jgi:glycosyltransferase involved in cell wall biosynthesis
MDAGVLSQQVLPHDATHHRALVLERGERIVPTLRSDLPAERLEPVSLIIPTFFNRSLKSRALRHLLAGIERSRAIEEVVLVTAGSSDGEETSLSTGPAGKRLIVVDGQPNRRGPSRNLGAAAASNDLLLFLDDDMLLRDWRAVDVLVSAMLDSRADSALFPRRHYARFPLLYRPAELERFVARWRSEADALEDPDLIDPIRHGSPYRTMTFCFPGCFMLIARAAYERIGGFPSEYEGWGFEDAVVALRAVGSLRVLNLFRRGEPLLHIDHPVSPYKTEEYRANLQKFSASQSPMALDWLCRRIFKGADFPAEGSRGPVVSEYLEPLTAIAESYRIPLVADEVASNYRAILRNRLELGCDSIPAHIVLHGSRGNGTSCAGSDYDLLFLYRDGPAPEYFVCQADGSPPVEIEFSDVGKFETFATRPACYPLFGPLELAKIAQGLLLWGDAETWDRWSDWLLRTALRLGRTCWLLQALGMGLRPEKVGVLRDRFIRALGILLRRVDADPAGEARAILAEGRLEPLAAHLRRALDAEIPGWREETAVGRRVFAFQGPEVWAALRSIREGD